MEIYLVRHGIAENASSSGSDAARRLTAEGREKTARVAKAFRKRVDQLDVIFHSPYVRARETAELMAAEFSAAPLVAANGLTPHDSPREALPLIFGKDAPETLMIVGHEPHLSSLASLLLTGREAPIFEFRKAGIAGLESHGSIQACRLMFLLSPKWM